LLFQINTSACRVASLLMLVLSAHFASTSNAQEIAIVTNAKNSTAPITQADAINIFMGRYRQFNDGRKAKPIDNNSIKNNFYNQLVNKSPAEIKAYWARLVFSGRTHPPKEGDTTEKVIDFIKSEKQAITYIPLSHVDKNVKVLLVLGENKQ